MKWCVSYKCNTDVLKAADEIRYSSFNEIFPIKDDETYAAKRLILEILDFSELTLNNQPMTPELMGTLLDGMPNLYIDFYRFEQLLDFVDQTGPQWAGRYMFHYPIDTYALLNTLLFHQVSDITLDEPLAFDIKNVEHYIHYDNPDVKIRLRPYVGRASYIPGNDDMCHFWVLPQHIKFYEPYVYAIDILANETMREEALYRTYTSGNYNLDLSALLEHFDTDPPMKGVWIDDAMALRRMECRQICQSTKPNRCHICKLEHQMLKVMPRAAYMREHQGESQS